MRGRFFLHAVKEETSRIRIVIILIFVSDSFLKQIYWYKLINSNEIIIALCIIYLAYAT
jgi:hypothetical protein